MSMLRLWKIMRSDQPCIFVIVAALICLLSSSSANAATRTYTLDADFDEGILFNLNHDVPNNNQLQLNATSTPFPFIWIACSSRGTVVRLDVNTGTVLGEYWSSPAGRGKSPSRTTVDLFGNVWTGNRAETSGGSGSAVKIGLVIGGTRGDKNPDGSFTPNPVGQYVAPPYDYNTCVDRDADGLIKTSMGLGDIRSWPDFTDGAGGLDGIVQDADNEAILLYQRTDRASCGIARADRATAQLGSVAAAHLRGRSTVVPQVHGRDEDRVGTHRAKSGGPDPTAHGQDRRQRPVPGASASGGLS